MKWAPALLLLLLVLFAIACDYFFPGGGTIYVSGQPFDFVILQLSNSSGNACCASCVISAPVPLDGNGAGSHSGLLDGSADGIDPFWLGTGLYSGCSGLTSLPCSGTSNLSCSGATGTVKAYGTITITDRYLCHWDPNLDHWACPPSTVLTLTVNGVQITYTAMVPPLAKTTSDASAAAANGLATAINNTSSLVGVVVAAASANQVQVTGASGSTDASTLHLYPWSASATQQVGCNPCTFSFALAPLQTMGTRPPL